MHYMTDELVPHYDDPTGGTAWIISVLRQRPITIISVAIVTAVAFTLYAFLATPIYHAATVLSPTSPDHVASSTGGALGQLGGLASLAGIGMDPRDAATEEALAVLRSREFMQAFITDHDLLPRLFPSRTETANHWWQFGASRAPTLARGAKYLREKVIVVTKDKKTGLVTLSVDWWNREEAASWANELASRVNSEMRTRAMTNATAYLAYLEKALETTQLMGTRDAINHLIENQIKDRMIASVTQGYAFRLVDHALPPDADDFVSPKRLLLVVCGPLVGLLLGCLAVLVPVWLRRATASAPLNKP